MAASGSGCRPVPWEGKGGTDDPAGRRVRRGGVEAVPRPRAASVTAGQTRANGCVVTDLRIYQRGGTKLSGVPSYSSVCHWELLETFYLAIYLFLFLLQRTSKVWTGETGSGILL